MNILHKVMNWHSNISQYSYWSGQYLNGEKSMLTTIVKDRIKTYQMCPFPPPFFLPKKWLPKFSSNPPPVVDHDALRSRYSLNFFLHKDNPTSVIVAKPVCESRICQ